MPNHPSVIARPTETGFAGRYVHNSGHPTSRVPLLRTLYTGAFAGDLDAMTKFLVDDHPAGWSQFGADPTVNTGWDNSRSSVHYDEFICYCHGDRNEAGFLRTEDNTDTAQADWVYVLRPEGIEVIDLDDGKTIPFSWQADPNPAPVRHREAESLALDPKDIAGVDEATALGIATLWNAAIPAIHRSLNRQIAALENAIRLAGEPVEGLIVMATDALSWIEDIGDGSPNVGPSDSPRLLGLIGDCLYVNERAPRGKVAAYKFGPVYRLLAELADQADAYYRTFPATTSA